MKKLLKLVAIAATVVASVVATSCSSDSSEELNAFYDASPADFKEKLETLQAAGADYVIIDYRSAEDYAEGHITGAINKQATAQNTQSNSSEWCTWLKNAYPTTTYIMLYGQDASQEYYVAGRVSKLGYGKSHTWSLTNGYAAWAAAYPSEVTK